MENEKPREESQVKPPSFLGGIDRWGDRQVAKFEQWAIQQEKRVETLSQRVDRWVKRFEDRLDRDIISRTVAIYRKHSLPLAELHAHPAYIHWDRTIGRNPWASSEPRGYGKAQDEFLEDFDKRLTQEIKRLPDRNKSERVRWITATMVDEFLTQAGGIKNEERLRDVFLLTSRQVFLAGIKQSEQFPPGKIDPLWVHEIQGKITNQVANPGVELTSLRDQLRSSVDNPPLPRSLEAPSH